MTPFPTNNRQGFHLDAVLEGGGWRPLHLDSTTPLVETPRCPADGEALRTVVTLVSVDGTTRIRVGACPSCGHLTYVDRPAASWFESFYRDVWDDAASRTAPPSPRAARSAPRGVRPAITLATALPIDRGRPVCEIGCGHGIGLQQLAAAGFTTLVGIEPSRHRADLSRAAGAFEVLSEAIEAPATVDRLRALGPFGLIYSIHAIEHMVDPAAAIATAAGLQRDGDVLIVSVPNQAGEPSLGVLLFLPHLHSFTRQSLVRLAARHGYGTVDDSAITADDLTIVFRKGVPGRPLDPGGDGFDDALTKLTRGLALDHPHDTPARLSWSRKKDDARWEPLDGAPTRERSIVASDLRPRVTAPGDSPLEIQSDGGVTLFYK